MTCIRRLLAATVAVFACLAYPLAEAGQDNVVQKRGDGAADSMIARHEGQFRPNEVSWYRMGIKPEHPDTGIRSGYFIAYGHPVAPPYVIEIKEDSALCVNGVQVYPPLPDPVQPARFAQLMAPVRSMPDSVKRLYALVDTVTKRAYAFYANAAAVDGESSALRTTGDMVMKSGIADSVKLGYPGVLRIYEKQIEGPLVLFLETRDELRDHLGRLPSGLGGTERHSRLDVARLRAANIRGELAGGRAIVVTPGEYGYLGGADVFYAARALLSDETLSQSRKWALLQSRGFSGGMAYWLLANYAEREWQR